MFINAPTTPRADTWWREGRAELPSRQAAAFTDAVLHAEQLTATRQPTNPYSC